MQTSPIPNARATPRVTFAARSSRLLTLLLLTLTLGASACTTRQGDVTTDDEGTTPIPFQAIGIGTYVGDTDLESVARTDAQWQLLSDTLSFARPARLTGDSLGGAMVLAVGVRAEYGGFGVRFVGLEQDSVGIEATYGLFVPGEECSNAPAPQQPFAAVKAPRIDAPVRFTRIVETSPCVID